MGPVLRVTAICLVSVGLATTALPQSAVQERILPVPPNVTIDGVPPIPMSVLDGLSPYAQFRRARLVSWHPAERRMLIATRFGDAPQLHEVRFPGGARRQLTFYRDGVTDRPLAAFDASGRSFVFQKDIASGGEANQLFRYDFATGAISMLTDGRSRNEVPVVGRKSGAIAYSTTRRNGKDRDLYVLKHDSPEGRVLLQGEGVWFPLDWSPDESRLLAIEAISNAQTFLWMIDAGTGAKTALSERSGPAVRWASAVVAPDGRTVYGLANIGGEGNRLWRRDSASGQWTALTPAAESLETFALSPDGRSFALVVDRGERSELRLADASGRVRVTPSLPPGVITDLSWHPGGQEIGFSLAGARTFHDVYSVNATTGKVEQWTWSEIGGANPESLPDAEIVRWKSFDGLVISGVLYRPPARFTGPRPVIINVHGGPDERERSRPLGRSNYFRNEMGIAVLYPNVRGSAGFGRTFEQLDNGPLRENAVKDIGALLDWIATQPSLDKNRVMIAGPSYGGYVALAAATLYGDRLRAVNPAFGITDFPSFLESTDMSRQANRNAEYGDPADPATREFLTKISPLTNAAKLKIPVYIVAGAKDTRVPVSQAERMVTALKANGTPVWYVLFQDAGHLQINNTNNDFSLCTWVMFVQKYLVN